MKFLGGSKQTSNQAYFRPSLFRMVNDEDRRQRRPAYYPTTRWRGASGGTATKRNIFVVRGNGTPYAHEESAAENLELGELKSAS